jgi:hypothetical protein
MIQNWWRRRKVRNQYQPNIFIYSKLLQRAVVKQNLSTKETISITSSNASRTLSKDEAARRIQRWIRKLVRNLFEFHSNAIRRLQKNRITNKKLLPPHRSVVENNKIKRGKRHQSIQNRFNDLSKKSSRRSI